MIPHIFILFFFQTWGNTSVEETSCWWTHLRLYQQPTPTTTATKWRRTTKNIK